MLERIFKGELSLQYRPHGRLFPILKDPPQNIATELKDFRVRRGNLRNIRKIVEYLERFDDGCFWGAMYMVYADKFKNTTLPEAEQFLDYIKNTQYDLLVNGTLRVKHAMFGQAYDLYGNLNIPITRMVVNNEAVHILTDTTGENWRSTFNIPLVEIDTDLPLAVNGLATPHVRWVHQSASDNSHTVADIGRRESSRLIRSYELEGFRQIAIVEF